MGTLTNDDEPQAVRALGETLRRALMAEAKARGLTPPPGLFEVVSAHLDEQSQDVRKLFGNRPPLALVGFDTPGIQEYVFKVRRPVDLFGGSLQVADFTNRKKSVEGSLLQHFADAKVEAPESRVIYAGGGGGLLLVAAVEAEAVVEALGRILQEVTRDDLRTVTAVLEVWPEEVSSTAEALPEGLEAAVGPLRSVSRYAATMSALTARRSRERSLQAQFGAPIPPHRHPDRCDACLQKVAVTERLAGDEPEKICGSCEARWRYGSRNKKESEQPQTFEDMVRGLPETSLAVLYADGANVGGAFQRIESMAQHRALSQAVDEAMEEAGANALAASPWLAGEEGYRSQTAISGGDDLVLVLPALAVPDAVEPLISTFEAAFNLERNARLRRAFSDAPQELRDRIGVFGVGVGIAIADFHFPIQFLVNYARELLKSAKKRIRQGERSAVDFLVLRSGTPLSESIADLRKQHFKRKPEGKRPGLQFTRRPLSCDEFADLVKRARLLEDHVPTSQIHAIRQEIFRGPDLSRSLWRYQHARAKNGKGWAKFREELKWDLADIDRHLWTELPGDSERKGRWLATDYLDALDLFDFVKLPTNNGRIAA